MYHYLQQQAVGCETTAALLSNRTRFFNWHAIRFCLAIVPSAKPLRFQKEWIKEAGQARMILRQHSKTSAPVLQDTLVIHEQRSWSGLQRLYKLLTLAQSSNAISKLKNVLRIGSIMENASGLFRNLKLLTFKLGEGWSYMYATCGVFFVKDKFLVLLFILDSFKNLVKCIMFQKQVLGQPFGSYNKFLLMANLFFF